ncbi:hypothetical protein [Candidatus Ruminimicrobiellum ovillum]|uniref:hypothetical protein n=1 Tax=Candidatus Ruminimicrobiellum ovillum TaxID=1947927 RepID=UPI00355ACC0B
MIDTVKLMLTAPEIRNKDLFVYKTDEKTGYRFGYLKPINDGIYRPSLLYFEPDFFSYLYVRFSIPKFLFGNNLQEVKESQFEDVVNKLVTELNKLGITVSADAIRYADIRGVDYSKNFILSPNLTTDEVLDVLKLSKYSRMKLFTSKYPYIKFHSKSLSILFYDKLKEMTQHGGIIPNFSKINSSMKNRIFRTEIQFRNTYGVKERLAKIIRKGKHSIRFKEIFNENMMKIVFNHCLRKLNENMPDIILEGNEEEELKEMYGNKVNKIAKEIAILKCQKDCGSYKEGIQKAIKYYGENFVENHKCVLVNDTKLQFILLKLLEELKEYKPLFDL